MTLIYIVAFVSNMIETNSTYDSMYLSEEDISNRVFYRTVTRLMAITRRGTAGNLQVRK